MAEGPITSGNVTIGANGSGTLSLGPARYGEQWRVSRMVTSVSATGITTEILCELKVYRDVVAQSTLVDVTQRAGSDVSETDLLLRAPEKLVFVWANAPVGALASIVVTGEYDRGLS